MSEGVRVCPKTGRPVPPAPMGGRWLLDGTPRGTVTLPTAQDDADPVAGRQWHHWNRLESALDLDLKAGFHLVRIAFRAGNTNLDYLEFHGK
jgi:hypothetical protein